MKRRTIITGTLLLGLLVWIAVRRDSRLVGVYIPDAEQTHSRWSFGRSLGLEGVKGVLSQVFNEESVRMTDNSMILRTARGIETNRLWILSKGRDHCTAFMAPTSMFRFELVDDGLWFVRRFSIPREEYPLVVKLRKVSD